MRYPYWKLACVIPLLFCATAARAALPMTCSQAATLISRAPAIEGQSITSIIVAQWQRMDERTLAAQHAAIAPSMMNNSSYMQMLNAQCTENPGQPITAAAAQVYLQARMTLDGY